MIVIKVEHGRGFFILLKLEQTTKVHSTVQVYLHLSKKTQSNMQLRFSQSKFVLHFLFGQCFKMALCCPEIETTCF